MPGRCPGNPGAAARRLGAFITGAIVVLGLGPLPALAQQPLDIVATTAQVGDLVGAIAGDRAQVTSLMGPGVDPHLYQATRSDTARLINADAVFYNGLFLEGRMEDLLEDLAAQQPVVALGEAVPERFLRPSIDYADEYDPHIWHDVRLWTYAAEAARDALIDIDPANAEAYRENAVDHIGALQDLHEYALSALASVPEDRRVLVTAHDAFGYFGAAYGFEVVGIQGISTESEAGLARIEAVVDLLVDRDIPAVFVETSVSDRNIQALIAGAAAEEHEVRVGGTLYSDAMGAPGSYEGTYIGMIDHNVTAIAEALGGAVPHGGFARGRENP
jgi:manganese/zinc/iron transport system substrate-binding protein